MDKQRPVDAKEVFLAHTSHRRFFISDDEQILPDVTGSMLKYIGYDVVMVNSRRDAMEYYWT